jgi:hypothetical protein
VRRAALGLCLAATLSACGGAGGPDPIVRTGPSPAIKQPDGTLSADPVPLTLMDVADERQGSPQQAVLKLLFWAQWGGAPFIAELYDEETIADVGLRSLTREYEDLRAELVELQPEVAFTCHQGDLVFVAIILRSRGQPRLESFLLRRRVGDWVIVSDTLVERGLMRSPIVVQSTRTSPQARRNCDVPS